MILLKMIVCYESGNRQYQAHFKLVLQKLKIVPRLGLHMGKVLADKR